MSKSLIILLILGAVQFSCENQIGSYKVEDLNGKISILIPSNWIVKRNDAVSTTLSCIEILLPNRKNSEPTNLLISWEEHRTEFNKEFKDDWSYTLIEKGWKELEVMSTSSNDREALITSGIVDIQGKSFECENQILNFQTEKGSIVFTLTHPCGTLSAKERKEIWDVLETIELR